MISFLVRNLFDSTDFEIDIVGVHFLFERVVYAFEVELGSVGYYAQSSKAKNYAQLICDKNGCVNLEDLGTEFHQELQNA